MDLASTLCRVVLRIQDQEEHVLVDEMVVEGTEALGPGIPHGRAGEVVIAPHPEHGGRRPRGPDVEHVPFLGQAGDVFALALDEVAHIHDQFGP
jgi:hypothetical protein